MMGKWQWSIKRGLIIALMVVFMAAGMGHAQAQDSTTSMEQQEQWIQEVVHSALTIIQQYALYDDIDQKEMLDNVMYAIAESMSDDAYAGYVPAEMLEDVLDPFFTDGLYHYIGIEYEYDDHDLLILTHIEEGSPAAESDLEIGDQIVSVNGRIIKMYNDDVFFEEIQQTAIGDFITLKVVRDGKSKIIQVAVQETEMEFIESAMLPGKVGYIAFEMFNEISAKQIEAAQQSFIDEGMKSLIIDLRYNGGGDVDAALQIASLFLKDQTVFHLINKHGEKEEVTIDGGQAADYPIYILMNEFSASASEMLIGALHDHGIATTIGTTTFGKGIMQKIFFIEETGGLLQVTTDKYVTPNGHEVHDVGLKPDIFVEEWNDQNLQALRKAKVESFIVDGLDNMYGYAVNGLHFGFFDRVMELGHDFSLSSRTIAMLLDAELTWHGDTFSVTLDYNGTTASFALADDSLKLHDGTSYISLTKLSEAFQGIEISEAGELIIATGL